MTKEERNKLIETFVNSTGVLTPHQQEIYNELITDIDNIVDGGGQWDNVVSLVGAAGVGKTFMSVKIIESLLMLGHSVMITTPTHKSLKVVRDMLKNSNITISSSTIHSFLNLKLKPNLESGIQELIADALNKDVKKYDILIVDESSMVSETLFNHIEMAIRYRRAKCVFFIGDKFQLTPVDGEQNPVFSQNGYRELLEIVRQAQDNPIIALATDIRDRIERKDFIPLDLLVSKYECKEISLYYDGKEFMQEYFNTDDDIKWFEQDNIIASYTNESVDKYNRAVRKKYWIEQGVESVNYLMPNDIVIFQDAHIEDEAIIHSNNDIAKIISCEKEFDDELSCWYWKCIDEDNLKFKVIDPISKVLFDKNLAKIADVAMKTDKFARKQLWEKYYQIKGSYQNIKYGFASTVHKLQGSTYEHCYIDMREMRKFYEFQDKEFIYRLLYVAVTRASKDIKILV